MSKGSLVKSAAYAASIVLVFACSDVALAEGEGLTGVVNRLTAALGSFKQLIIVASYIAGIGFFMSGLIKFKAHRDAPTQVPLSAPIVLVCIGAALVFMPSIIQTAGETAFEEAQSGGADGSGLEI